MCEKWWWKGSAENRNGGAFCKVENRYAIFVKNKAAKNLRGFLAKMFLPLQFHISIDFGIL